MSVIERDLSESLTTVHLAQPLSRAEDEACVTILVSTANEGDFSSQLNFKEVPKPAKVALKSAPSSTSSSLTRV
ncbi:hypothetical protein PROFUN_07940 [Planoprotostelium fungivorum]|uniref:Uncharacterized protein n=1 Tax=Planoprotostelium fungivorum TaxID=1890364 RepID=A0A2P6NL53_9EUKA|nr:hypothetical protein PROFUN_07940 [Planoprotostelium fungivorum]